MASGLRNFSEACRRQSVSRNQFYEYKRVFRNEDSISSSGRSADLTAAGYPIGDEISISGVARSDWLLTIVAVSDTKLTFAVMLTDEEGIAPCVEACKASLGGQPKP